MKCKTIAETGAKPGDTVKCVGLIDESLNAVRYTIGRTYKVVDWFGRPMVEANSHGAKVPTGDRWLIPFGGAGAVWELASGG